MDKRSLSQLFLVAALLFALLPFALLCRFNQPYLDDFAWATLFRTRGFWPAQSYLYHHINGRFVTAFLLTAGNPLSYGGPQTLGLANLAINALTLGSLWFGLRSLLQRAVRPFVALLLAGGLFLFFIAVIPDIHSSLYWFASQVTHHLTSLFLLLAPVSVARFHRAGPRAAKTGWLGLAAAGAFLTGGSSELVTLLLGWLLLAACGVSVARREGYHASVWAGLLVVLAGTAVFVVIAPSNVERLRPAMAGATGIAAKLAQFWQPHWLGKALLRLLLTPGVALIVACPLLLSPLAPAVVAVRPRGLQLPLVFSAGVLLGGVLLGALLMQLEVMGPDIASRCANVLLWWLLLGWLVACWAALPAAATPPKWPNRVVRYGIGALLLAFIAAPVRRAWREVLVEAPSWNRQCWQRYTLLQRLAGTTPHVKVQVPPIRDVVPHYVLIRGYDIANGYNSPYNRDMAAYFGVDSVRVDPKARNAAF
ncbi:hypothetical protein HNP98_000016 [Hymenobacter sp. 9A]|uniref:YfhO family protein n=2 Tax=Hymenobacter caeli TaxID=2735894 RepID=A0ABX2FJC2_9BACT|nr:hypothetical protein [Hymenobacter caeli]